MWWHSFTYVTTGLTLVAFLALLAVGVIRAFMLRQERLIRRAPPDKRAALIKDTIEFFHVNTANLVKDKQYQVAVEQIRARAARWTIGAALVALFLVLGSGLAVFAMWQNSKDDSASRETQKANYIRLNVDTNNSNLKALDKASAAHPQNAGILNEAKEALNQDVTQQVNDINLDDWSGAALVRQRYNDKIDKLKKVAPSFEGVHLLDVPKGDKPTFEQMRQGQPPEPVIQ
jgi:type II secretory pathway component PulL